MRASFLGPKAVWAFGSNPGNEPSVMVSIFTTGAAAIQAVEAPQESSQSNNLYSSRIPLKMDASGLEVDCNLDRKESQSS
jgi:hypothetical protein